VNNERKTIAFAYKYNVSSGKLERIGSAQLLQDEKAAEGIERVEPSDILVHPNGKYLYVSVRGVNLIAVLDVDETGTMTLKQNISCEGAHPRGFCLSPDQRYLFSANMIAGNIATFAIGDDGCLTPVDSGTKGVSPANMVIVENT
jgi:6-phosphogluconolactonase (cycloisomerase 2 family)